MISSRTLFLNHIYVILLISTSLNIQIISEYSTNVPFICHKINPKNTFPADNNKEVQISSQLEKEKTKGLVLASL